jgi:hypothetical protein
MFVLLPISCIRTSVLTCTNPQDKDTLKDLRSSIYYYENVADAKGDYRRDGMTRTTADKLKSVLAQVEKEIEGSATTYLADGIDCVVVAATELNIATMRDQAATLLDCPELQRARVSRRK